MRRSARLTTNVGTTLTSSSGVTKTQIRRVHNDAAKEGRAAKTSGKAVKDDHEATPRTDDTHSEASETKEEKQNDRLASKKWSSWQPTAASSPFPDFSRPTTSECDTSYRVLHDLHHADVEKEFRDPDTPESIAHVLDAVVIAILSAATGWNNAKRAMASMRTVYGDVYAYDAIFTGGRLKLENALRPGGLHVRKSTLIYSMLEDVRSRYGKWDMDFLFDFSDEDAMKELLSYKGIGPKCAFVVMGWCLKRQPFTVDTHVYRIAGLWGWLPAAATREKAQAHLNVMVPRAMKLELHFLLIQHGRSCPACKGGSKGGKSCDVLKELKAAAKP